MPKIPDSDSHVLLLPQLEFEVDEADDEMLIERILSTPPSSPPTPPPPIP